MEYTNNQAPVRPQMPSGTPFWRSKMAFLAFAVLAVLAVGWFLFFREEGIPGANKIETVTLSGTVFSYPGNWQQLQATATEQKAGIVLKLGSANPTGSFVWRALKGKLDKDVIVSSLPDGIANSLTSEVAGTKIISKGLTKLGTKDAVKINYTRPASTGSKVTNQNVMYVVPRPNQTDYLTFSSKVADFSKLEPGFSKILSSFVTYITAHP